MINTDHSAYINTFATTFEAMSPMTPVNRSDFLRGRLSFFPRADATVTRKPASNSRLVAVVPSRGHHVSVGGQRSSRSQCATKSVVVKADRRVATGFHDFEQ